MTTQDVFNNFLNKTLVGTNDSDQHLTTLFGITLQLKAKNILELGVRHSDTSEPLVVGASMVGGTYTGVDINPTEWVCPDELKPYYKFIQSDAIKFLKQEVQRGAYYNLVYVDDLHTYDHVKKELELIDKITDKKSIVLLHDLMAYTHPDYNLEMMMAAPSDSEWANGGPIRAVLELDTTKVGS